MTPEFWIASAAVVTFLGTLLVTVLRTGSSVGKALIELALCKNDVSKLQTETQQLRDAKVEHSTLIAQVMTQLMKLDKIEQLASSVAALTASVGALASSVERLERKVDARREDSHRD